MKREENKQIKNMSDENKVYNVLPRVAVTAQGRNIHRIVQDLLLSI